MRKLRLRGWLVFHQIAVVCLHQQQGGLLSPTVGEVEHLAAAALCQQVVDGKAAGLAIGDELDGLCAMLLQVAQGVQVAGKGGRIVGTGVGAQGAVLAHGKGLVHALSVHHPQLKGAVGVDRLALGGTAVGAGVGAVAVVLPVVAGALAALALTCVASTACADFSADKSITVISREEGSGTRGAFVELTGVEQKIDGKKVDMTTDDAQITNNTAAMLMTVAGDTQAIGYVSLGSLNETVKAVKIEGSPVAV